MRGYGSRRGPPGTFWGTESALTLTDREPSPVGDGAARGKRLASPCTGSTHVPKSSPNLGKGKPRKDDQHSSELRRSEATRFGDRVQSDLRTETERVRKQLEHQISIRACLVQSSVRDFLSD
jgi:hypothetical protein